MIYSRNLHDEKRPYLTELAGDNAQTQPVVSDSGRARANLSPSELLQAALAGCTNMTARELLDEENIVFDDLTVEVGMKVEDGKTVISRSVKISADAPEEKLREISEKAKDCYVFRILTGDIEIIDE